MKEPLAQRLRPRTLDEVCGQRHLLAPGQVFRRTIDRGVIPNMIFYGPSGVGKTTVASIIAANSGMRLYKLNLFNRLRGSLRKIGDFHCDYRKSLSALAGSRCLDGSIDSKKIGLICDISDSFRKHLNLLDIFGSLDCFFHTLLVAL